MNDILKIDFETRSPVEIGSVKGVGLYNYFNHPKTEILMLAHKFPGETGPCRNLYEPHLGPPSKELLEHLHNPNVMIEAYNSAFERYGLGMKMGIEIPPERFIDPQVACRYLCLPADLESCSNILDLPFHLKKDSRGDGLIKLFSTPKFTKKKRGGPAPEMYFNNWESHPAEWQAFREYAMRDVDAEEEVLRRCEMLGAWPMPEFERELWCFDQRVNDRGMPVDMNFVERALFLAEKAKEDSLEAQNAITGLQNSNSRDQLLPWVKARGYTYNTLNKAFVEAALGDTDMILTDECREVLVGRLSAGSTSYTKMNSVKRHVCPDGTIKNMFIYLGSSRCGRWSGNAVQPHNFPRPSHPKKVNGHDFEETGEIDIARKMIYAVDYQGIMNRYGKNPKDYGAVLEVVKSTLRTIFVVPGGQV